jgi:hypothetical protein
VWAVIVAKDSCKTGERLTVVISSRSRAARALTLKQKIRIRLLVAPGAYCYHIRVILLVR